MVYLLTQASKYILIILAALYTIHCFTVFRPKHAWDRGSIYMTQNILMFLMHFIMNMLILLNERNLKVLFFYLAQVVFFIVTLLIHSVLYRHACRLLVNNMCFLMMVGFVMISRLNLSLALRQFAIAVAGTVIALLIPLIISKFPRLDRIGWLYGVLGLGLIASVFVFGREAYGAVNWISIGPVALQPSELAKVVFVFFAASVLNQNTRFKHVVVISAVAAVFVLLLVAEKDLGAAVIFFVTYLIMLYVATQNAGYLVLGFCAFGGAAAAAYKLFDHVRTRVIAWRDPWSDYENKGYQIAQSLFAIGTGSWFGLGLYMSEATKIPVVISDFIFSAICEELGGLFGLCLILIYISCFIMFINISLQLTDAFHKLLAVGLSASYAFQLLLSTGGVIKLIPHTGVTMPLVSYGGSSILSTLIVFSVIQGLYLLRQEQRMAGQEVRHEKTR